MNKQNRYSCRKPVVAEVEVHIFHMTVIIKQLLFDQNAPNLHST